MPRPANDPKDVQGQGERDSEALTPMGLVNNGKKRCMDLKILIPTVT